MPIEANLKRLEAEIRAACDRAGRPRESVTLVAVSKNHPAEAVLEAVRAGQLIFGENRVQELREKAAETAAQSASSGVHVSWHMIGTLQTNKVKYLPGIVDCNGGMIHSVDSVKLAKEIDRQFAKSTAYHPQDILLEVNMAGEETKAGLAPGEVRAVLEEIASLSAVRVRGLMTIAPFTDDPESNRVYFRGLSKLMRTLNEAALLPEPMTELSMGMSGDFTVAIEEGATLIRVGTAIFGER